MIKFDSIKTTIKKQYKLKRSFLFASILLIGSSVALLSNSSGPASAGNGGRTGAPGEGNCSNCHGGGAFTPSVVISVFDAGTTTPATSYVGGITYDVQVMVSSTTGLPNFGFQLTTLNSSNTMAGGYSTPSSNAKISTAGARTYLEHNAISATGIFMAQWTAPTSGTGTVTFYAYGNCVNGTGGTSGDNATGTSKALTEAVCTPTTSSFNDTICSGNSYTFNGMAQTTAGSYLDTLVNAGGCDSVITLNLTVKTTPSAPTVTTDSVCAPGGIVNLSATGFNIQWFDQLLGGNLVNSGSTYNPTILADSTYYVTQEGGTSSSAVMPSQTGTNSGNTRGYWFTAPSNFTITSLQVPTTASSGNQSIAVVKFTGNTPPPIFSSTTNAFTTLFVTQNNVTAGNISVNIPIQAGEVIGILGGRSNVSSYSNTGNTTVINGNTVALERIGMQFQLSTTLPQDIWREPSSNISRVEFEYTIGNGCFSTPRTPVVAKVNALPIIGTVSATPSTICTGDSSMLKATAPLATNVWVTTPIVYTNSGVYNSANQLSCLKFTFSNTTTIDGFWFDNYGMAAGSFANIALYTDVAGSPGTKIIQGVEQNNMPYGYVFFPIANTILNSGTYWLGINTSGDLYTFFNTSLPPSVQIKIYTETYNSIFPTTVTSPLAYSGTGNANALGIRTFVTPPVSYAWSPSASVVNATADSTKAFPTATTTYTVTASNAAGCTVTSSVMLTYYGSGNLAQATTNNVLSTTGNATQTFTQNDGAIHTYTDASCNTIATVNDGVGGNVLGSTVSNVVVDATVQTYNGQPYARRHYTITPTNQGAATVTLYLTQADFDDYNANNGTYLDLPTGPADATGIANVRITKVNGVLGVGTPTVITPTLTWDAVNMYWTATFPVTSFSSFYFHTVNFNNAALPVTLLSFTGKKETSTNVLNWTTSMEQNNAYFDVQRSQDGRTFTTIAKVNTKAINGNSSVNINYDLIDENPTTGHNYYRLMQVDNDGRTSNSNVIDLYRDATGNVVNVYPNPTTSIINVELSTLNAQPSTIKLLDMSGRVIKEMKVTQSNTQIDMSQLSVGMYQLQVLQNNRVIATQKVQKK